MKRNLFRGKPLKSLPFDKNGWVYGLPIPIMVDGEMTDRIAILDRFEYFDESPDPHYEIAEVDPASVSQYIDLEDMNGIDIFEGDILVSPVPNSQLALVITDKRNCGSFEWYSDNYGVIGNVYDDSMWLEETTRTIKKF